MDMEYFMMIQNAYGTKNRRERDLAETNYALKMHWDDTYDTERVLLNGEDFELMIIHEGEDQVNEKTIKSLHENKIRIGDYVTWHGQHWIIDSVDPDHKTWYMGHMVLCTVCLHWQNKKGEIIERWGYSDDASKFADGTTRTTNVETATSTYSIYLPVDNETKVFKWDRRVAIDIDDSDQPEIYKVTNRKVLIRDHSYFDNGGLIFLTFEHCEFNDETDKEVVLENGTSAWVCDFKPVDKPPILDENSNVDAIIERTSDVINIGTIGRKFYAVFKDRYGNTLSGYKAKWSYATSVEFESSELIVDINDNYISFKILSEDYLDETIELTLTDEKNEAAPCNLTLRIAAVF